MSRPLILVIEDDAAIRRGLVDALTFGGYDVREAETAPVGLEIALELSVDLVLLDVMLPGGRSGFDVLDELHRAHPTLPVIMVTARGAEEDRVRGLRGGADDYVVKPFSATELLARVEAVLRRSPARPGGVRSLDGAGRSIDLERREVRFEDGEVRSLTEREADILRYLAASRDRAVARDELLRHVWGLNPRGIETRTVDMQVARLREKLATPNAAGEPDGEIITTVRGKGYMLSEAVTATAP